MLYQKLKKLKLKNFNLKKNTLERVNSRITEAEEQMIELKDSVGNHCSVTEWRKKNERNEESVRDLWDNIKHTNNGTVGVPKGNEQTWENIWRHKSWKPSQHKKGNTQAQEAQSHTK